MGQSHSPSDELSEFIRLFNDMEYELSHEALLPAWQHNMGDNFYKGLIQLAAAFQHWNSGNAFWAVDLFASAHNLLEKYAPHCEGLDVERLLSDIKQCYIVSQRAQEVPDGSVNLDDMPQVKLALVKDVP